jgi:peptide/nickel transport system substrate-binding protein
MELTRRQALLLLGAGVTLSALAACAPPAAAPPASASSVPAAAPAAAAQPRAGGTLRLGQAVEVAAGGQAGASALDGQNITPAPLSATWLGYESLIAYDAQHRPQPLLAESWDASPDLTRVKLNLRRGVQFHSGRDFTSDDVKWNLLRVRQPNLGAQFTNMSKWWTSIETPDAYTVELTSDAPRPAAFDLFDLLNMVDRELVEGPDYRTRSGATGPYRFVEYAQGQHIYWTKNPNYWQSGRPYLDEVHVQFIGDAQSMVVQFEAGQLDVVDSPPARDAARLRQDARYRTLVNDDSGQYWVMVANTTSGPTTDRRIRQALNYAVDRKRFIDTALNGVGEPEDLPWLPTSPAYDGAKRTRYTYDLDKAKALLADAGATSVSLDFLFNSAVPEIVTFAQLYQSDLARIGVTLNLKGVERTVYNDLAAKFQYGLLMSSSGFANFDPATLPLVSRYWDPNNNLAGLNDSATYKQLVEGISVEADPTRRKAALSQLNDFLLDESFTMPVATAKHVTVTRAAVNGFAWRASEAIDYRGIWLTA